MLDQFAQYIESTVEFSRIWGPLIIFTLMAIESSLIPFPSEVVMIPAGIIIARHGDFWWSSPVGWGFAVAVGAGLAGSMAGAYFNYYLALWLGRPFLHKYGRYFFLSPRNLDRAEEIFREYGDITTFVCRLLPAIRQLISLPAGLAKMDFARFSFFTALGAGIWTVILTWIGYFLGRKFGDKSYRDLVFEGKDVLHDNMIWIVLALVIIVAVYVWIHQKIMGGAATRKPQPAETSE